MDPYAGLPGLRPPAHGDRVSLLWWADLGRFSRLDRLADHLRDLDTAVCLGERWGTAMAYGSERQQLLYRATREGPGFLEREAADLGYRVRDLGALDEWLHTGRFHPRLGPFPFGDPLGLIQAIADVRSTRQLGAPAQVGHAEYHNPLEINLEGSGFLLLGTIYVLRLVRDWSHTRRIGAAQATQAESAARRATTHADFSQWLVDEAKHGRLHVSPSELVNLVTRPEVQALDRLADDEIRLQLPEGTDFTSTGSDTQPPDSGDEPSA